MGGWNGEAAGSGVGGVEDLGLNGGEMRGSKGSDWVKGSEWVNSGWSSRWSIGNGCVKSGWSS